MRTEYLVTGGLGFIGSALTRHLLADGKSVTVVDSMTYAADVRRLERQSSLEIIEMDVTNPDVIGLVKSLRPRVIVHMAAESHVTRSEDAEEVFFHTNVEGTKRMMEAACSVAPDLVIHVSTDEVYGPCEEQPFKETDKRPGEGLATSPYARSKAVADDLARSYASHIPLIVVRPSNCFGPWQHPEKAVPRWIIRALSGERLPVWGDGTQVRDWLHVDDACTALDVLIEDGEPGETYNIAPEQSPVTNFELATSIASLAGLSTSCVYLTEYDRPDHDRRYAVDSTRMRALGWRPVSTLLQKLSDTIYWHREHEAWWTELRGEAEALYDDAAEYSS
jgi:dTDP-glucose 4,6-dehydratase